MSSRYDRRDSRDSRSGDRSRDRRRSPGPSSSRRSPSPPPKPRDDKELPEAFGRIPDSTKDDDSNVLYRMVNSFETSPLGGLTKCLKGNRKIKVWTRNFKEVRGICTGYVIAFDKHWNLVMSDVDEVYLKPRKAKTPFLGSVNSAENFPELPKKTMKKKGDPKDPAPPPPPPPAEPAATEEGAKKSGEKKKKKRRKKKGPTTERRHIPKMFVRGDNIVMVAVLEDVESDAD